MIRAARLISKLQLPGVCLSSEELARVAWPLAVGKRIAARTRAVALFQSSLVVEVEDEIWQSQLSTLRGQILSKLKEIVGREIVQHIDFRLRSARRPVQRAERIRPSQDDEADRIADPVLRSVYRSSRKRSLA